MELTKQRVSFVFLVLTTMTIVFIYGYTENLHGFSIKALNGTKLFGDRSAFVTRRSILKYQSGMDTNEVVKTQATLSACTLNITKLRPHVSPEERRNLIARDPSFRKRVSQGGSYQPQPHPSNCTRYGNVAVIVPYRNREEQLPVFVNHMHSFLQAQEIAYTLFIIEMVAGIPFNRGLLMNVGFQLARNQGDYTCFVFHDVDLLPTNERNLYNCSEKIRHMSTGNSKNKYKVPYPTYFGGVVSFNKQQYLTANFFSNLVPYPTYFGGVVSFNKQQYLAVNGFSNLYFGWGLEDDDLLIRLKHVKLPFIRVESKVGRYEAMNHSKPTHDDSPAVTRKELIRSSRVRRTSEGANSLLYKMVKFETRELYTWALVGVNKTDIHNRYTKCNKKGWPCNFLAISVGAT